MDLPSGRQVWSVVLNNELFVRAYNGKDSSWYKSALKQKAGQIIAAGITKEVTFEQADPTLNDLIDDAYRNKYSSSPYLGPMVGDRARSATVKIISKN